MSSVGVVRGDCMSSVRIVRSDCMTVCPPTLWLRIVRGDCMSSHALAEDS